MISLGALSALPNALHASPCVQRRGTQPVPCRQRIFQVRAAVAEDAPPSKLPALAQPYGRVFNFAAGPAILPVPVLERAQADLLNYKGSGMSVMEMSHRSKVFDGIIKQAERDLRTLLAIPDNYKVMFLQGGASGQFASVPLNLSSSPDDVADYVVTGAWSKKAAEEAKKYLKVNIAAKGDGKSIPARDTWNLTPGAKYLAYCDNETIGGVEFKGAPKDIDTVLVADMSSNFLSKPVDVSKYGVIYAGVQKNVGPAGAVVVIVREDLLGHARPDTPTILDWKVMEDSLFNTPPCWVIYTCGLVFQHMLEQGGIAAIEKRNQAKAALVYDAIEASGGFYNQPVAKDSRSLMNIPFTIPTDPELEKKFIAEATKEGLLELKGHRSVGGMRASVYNAMPMEGAQRLADFMKDFAARHR
eukprot:jgi/Botrbrau1/5005/Bobra.0396s0026.1